MNIITETDCYLFGNGSNYEIYEKLGAHIMEIDGVRGTYFAVWAPHAKAVSVVGDFNDWNGYIHIMNRRRSPLQICHHRSEWSYTFEGRSLRQLL